ncbi:hypothetical protein KVV02_006839 [Mortierella alpina]|uniref:Cyclin-domain-containing protein n=1 Tax=Mortierella alpina TaxID=64518 RepID=A0A9P8AAF8_MORAP|nr:hypothetical protein KVV02_006839 [Mortierella alpina]
MHGDSSYRTSVATRRLLSFSHSPLSLFLRLSFPSFHSSLSFLCSFLLSFLSLFPFSFFILFLFLEDCCSHKQQRSSRSVKSKRVWSCCFFGPQNHQGNPRQHPSSLVPAFFYPTHMMQQHYPQHRHRHHQHRQQAGQQPEQSQQRLNTIQNTTIPSTTTSSIVNSTSSSAASCRFHPPIASTDHPSTALSSRPSSTLESSPLVPCRRSCSATDGFSATNTPVTSSPPQTPISGTVAASHHTCQTARSTQYCETCMSKSDTPTTQHSSASSPACHHPSRPSLLVPIAVEVPPHPQFDIVSHPIKDTLLIVSSLLSLLVHKNDGHFNPQVDPITLFHSRAVPRISVEAYLSRILQYIPFTNEVLLNVLVYLDRIGGLGGMQMELVEAVDRTEDNEQSPTPAAQPPPVPLVTPHLSDQVSTGPVKSIGCSTCHGPGPKPCATTTPPPLSASSFSTPIAPRSSAISSCCDHSFPASSKIQEDPDSHPTSACNSPAVSARFESSVFSNSNSDPPMIHKRGRGEQGHEGRETERSNDTSPHPPQQQEDDNDQQHASKKRKLECVTSKSHNTEATVSRPAVTIDTRSTPGGSTPMATPRLAMAANGFRVNSFNIHRLLITCLMVAAKFTSDHFYSNVRYAKVGGLSLLELNQLELEFLFTTRFELNVKVEELQRVGNALLRFRNLRNARAEHQRQRTASAQLAQHTPQAVQATNPSNSDPGRIINTAITRVVATSAIHQKVSRYWVPSPTSPKSGPMSDGQATSTSLSSTSKSITTICASERDESSSVSTTTVVVAVESGTQRAQLLSPPEEKQNWKGADIQENAEWIDQTLVQDQASQSSSIATATPIDQSTSTSHFPIL